MRTINLIGEIDEKLTKEILTKIFEIEQEDLKIIEENSKLADEKDHKKLEDLTINITSVGGLVYGFNAMYDALSKLQCKVITRGFGLCSSSGFYLMLAGEERYAGKGTEFLYHTLGYGMWHEKLQYHIEHAEYNNKVQERLDAIVMDKTNITKEMLKEKRKEDWWMLFDEALELGVIQGEI